jgi:hypothetical protein
MHLAAPYQVDRSISGSAEFVQTNFFGAYTLLEAVFGDGARKAAVAFITWCWVIRRAAVDSSRLTWKNRIGGIPSKKLLGRRVATV